MMDFSCYVSFRISGAGQRLFGDGIAIWFTDMTEADWRRGGDFFAGPKDFLGFVIVLDTFKNAEVRSVVVAAVLLLLLLLLLCVFLCVLPRRFGRTHATSSPQPV